MVDEREGRHADDHVEGGPIDVGAEGRADHAQEEEAVDEGEQDRQALVALTHFGACCCGRVVGPSQVKGGYAARAFSCWTLYRIDRKGAKEGGRGDESVVLRTYCSARGTRYTGLHAVTGFSSHEVKDGACL